MKKQIVIIVVSLIALIQSGCSFVSKTDYTDALKKIADAINYHEARLNKIQGVPDQSSLVAAPSQPKGNTVIKNKKAS